MKRLVLLFCCLSLLLLVWAEFSFYQSDERDLTRIQASLNEHLKDRKSKLSAALESFNPSPCQNIESLKSFPEGWSELQQHQGLNFIVYNDSRTLLWTNNAIPLSDEILRNKTNSQLWKLKNGWYLTTRDTFSDCCVLGLALVKTEFSYQNDYLKNGFPFLNDVSDYLSLSADSLYGSLKLNLYDNEVAAWVSLNESPDFIEKANNTQEALFALIFILLFIALFILVKSKQYSPRVIWGIWLFLLMVRFLIFYFNFPFSLYSITIFNPSEYAASNWLPTLGDLFLNSLLLLFTSSLIYDFIRQFIRKNAKKSIVIPSVFLTLFFLIAIAISVLIVGLIINSSISLDIRDVLSLTISSFYSFIIIGILFGSLFVLLHAIASEVNNTKLSAINQLSILAMAFPLSFALAFWMEQLIPLVFFTAIVIITSWGLHKKEQLGYSFLIAIVGCFAGLATFQILYHSSTKEKERRKFLAVKISAERDPIAESLFLETEQKLVNDTLLKRYLSPGVLPVGQVRDLAQLYFNGYWEKYSISVNVFGADECPMTALYTTKVKDPLTFDQLIDSVGIPTQSDRFFFLDDGSGRISYMARLPIFNHESDDSPLGTLYIEFQSRYTPEEIGYPELLLDKVVQTRTDLSSYSYARYNHSKLVSHYGTYPYELNDSIFRSYSNKEFEFIDIGEHNHLIYAPNNSSIVVLSKPLKGALQLLTHFSYLVLFFSLLALIPVSLSNLMVNQKFGPISFKRRVQFSIVLLLFISLILIGGGTIVYIISNSNQKNISNISEKIHSLLIETEYLLGKENSLKEVNADDLGYALTRQANVFFSDINIYDPEGILYASSRPKIFEEGLVSKMINPEAYFYLHSRKSSEYIHQETLGNLQYASAYVPLRNVENKVIGYLNLPYFARQDELRKEIFSFVVSIVNIYVLLIVLVIITAIFLSNTVTAPLKLVRERLSQMRLGKKNEPILWKGNDEIADLISEYNRMVEELADSAEKLAKSERETAWREMAKQVAHEIKNPLTPMKLSTQMLKRAWDDKAEGFDERIDRFTINLIEQIDALSHIATEFSNFAKMPKMKFERVNIKALLNSAVEFHQGENDVKIYFECELDEPCFINTDKEQMLRVFNNLIRNAIQAIPTGKDGEIHILMNKNEEFYHVEIKDNGAGIPEELKDKIFSPNFTTKNAGMGLGLALSKNIIENSAGKVWFESTPNIGTSFFIEIPVFSNT